MAVGCGWQTFVAYVNVGCYYGIGIPLGAVMGFYFKLNAKVYLFYFKLPKIFHFITLNAVNMQGIWLGMLGGTVLQTIILMWVTFRTDWNKEVREKLQNL